MEVVVAVAIGVLIVGAVVTGIAGILRGNVQNKQLETAAGFAGEYFTVLTAIAEQEWHDIYNLNKGASSKYYINLGSAPDEIVSGEEGFLDDDIRSGLVAHWRLDEATGTVAYDATANSLDGAISGPTFSATSTCRIGRCFSFDGVNDYVSVPDASALNPTSTITLSAWFRANDIAGQIIPPIVKKADASAGYSLEIDNTTSQLRFYVFVGGAWRSSPASAAIATGKWYHAVGVYDGSNIRLYIDGQEVSPPTSQTGSITAAINLFNIGRDPANTTRLWDGLIDDVRIYNRALSADEVWKLYNSNRYTRYFYVENVCRTSAGAISGVPPCGSDTEDPSTQKITVNVGWTILTEHDSFTHTRYLTRYANHLFSQTDWSGGAGIEGPITATTTVTFATSSNIHFATSGEIRVKGF